MRDQIRVPRPPGRSKISDQASPGIDPSGLQRRQCVPRASPPALGRVFDEVITAAPDFAGGYAGAAYIHAFLGWWGHTESPDEDIQAALALANQALERDPDFGLAYSALAFAQLHNREFDKALDASRNAIRVLYV